MILKFLARKIEEVGLIPDAVFPLGVLRIGGEYAHQRRITDQSIRWFHMYDAKDVCTADTRRKKYTQREWRVAGLVFHWVYMSGMAE